MRVLGIDYGERRVGLALSDPSATLARPWRTLARAGSDEHLARELAGEIAALAAGEDGLGAVVVGLPRRLDGTPNDLTARVEAFAERLRALVGLPVVLQDERLTSAEAESRLARRERDWRKRKARVDAAAAAVILQDYLDSATPPSVATPEAGA